MIVRGLRILVISVLALVQLGCAGVAAKKETSGAGSSSHGSSSLTANPNSVDFGDVLVGDSNSHTISVSNSGTATLTVSHASLTGSGFTITAPSLPISLQAGQSVTLTVWFSPLVTGSTTGTVTITGDTPSSPTSVALTGKGVSDAVSATPASINFGNVSIGSDSAQTVTLTSRGSGSVTVSRATVAGVGFSIVGLSLPQTLEDGRSISFSVNFAPVTAGSVTGSISLQSSASNSPTNVQLVGNGIISSSSVQLAPGDDLQAAVDQNPEGTTFVLTPGLYRRQRVNPKDGDAFVGEPGAIMNGANLVTSFTQETVDAVTYWVAPGPTTHGQMNGQCDSTHPACTYPEDLFIADKPLTRVAALANVASGKCFFSYSAGKIYFLDNPTGQKVEVSQTRSAFGPPSGETLAANVTIRGLVIEKYASPGDMGAVGDQHGGDRWTIENNEIRLNHGAGILGTSRDVIRSNSIHDNGQIGITGTGTTDVNGVPDILVESNEVFGNNYAGFDLRWGTGGIKFSYTLNLIVRNNYVHDNNGAGLWTDTDNRATLYENNRVVANMGVGIWHELSYDVIIRYNTLIRNGLVGHPWLFASQILIANSSNAEVYNNHAVVDGNLGTTGRPGNGIVILQQDRSADGPAFYTINNSIHHNDVTYLGDLGRSGAGVDTLPGQPYDPQIMYDGSNLFDYNVYHALHFSGPSGQRWNWKCDTAWDCQLDWAGFQAQGQEAHGIVDTNVVP